MHYCSMGCGSFAKGIILYHLEMTPEGPYGLIVLLWFGVLFCKLINDNGSFCSFRNQGRQVERTKSNHSVFIATLRDMRNYKALIFSNYCCKEQWFE